MGGFLIWGFGGDYCGVYRLVVLLAEVFVFCVLFFFSRHVQRRTDVTAEANRKKARRPISQLREYLRICTGQVTNEEAQEWTFTRVPNLR